MATKRKTKARRIVKRKASTGDVCKAALAMVRRELQRTAKAVLRKPLAEQPYDYSEGITQSLICSWLDCRQRARFSLDGWQMVGTTEALEFGSMFHWLLEHTYKLVISGDIKGWKDAIAVFETLIGEYLRVYEEKRNESSLGAQKIELLASQAEGIWGQYCRHWHHDFTKTKWLELEGVFDAVWEDAEHGPHRLRGMRDGVFERKDGLWWLETKTKGQWSLDTLERTLPFNHQNLFYILAGELTLNEPVAGVLYNIVRRPQIKPAKDGNLRDYVKRLQADTEARPDFYFARLDLTYSKKERALFRQELDALLGEFQQWLRGEIPNYRNRSACEGRKFNCRFIDACSKGHLRGYTQTGRLFVELEG